MRRRCRLVLLLHVAKGKLTAAKVVKRKSIKTLNGQRLKVKVRKGEVFVGGARVTTLKREEVEGVVLAGFFPEVHDDARALPRGGIVSFGLPYERDPAITRHLTSPPRCSTPRSSRITAPPAARSSASWW